MAKHTPGPWEVHQDADEEVTVRHEGGHVCDMHWGDNNKVDARLIAAAPEMLEALEMVKKWAITDFEGDWQRAADAVFNAIAKAKGAAGPTGAER